MVKVREKVKQIADKPAHENDNNDEKIYFMHYNFSNRKALNQVEQPLNLS